jgi:3-deoxy-manno-octulosonate cytidylyltransferase (CMP-KDO synthetase)
MHEFLGIIPARFASTRFPGKPLADINGKAMILRVLERAEKALDDIIVATDDQRIYDIVSKAGGKAIITSPNHQSGTDRCYEALLIHQGETHRKYDIVINIQGDEPFIQPEQIELLMQCFKDPSIDIATLVKVIEDKSLIFDTNKPKVVLNRKREALYFSRSPIPFIRGAENDDWFDRHIFYQHIGMYAYRSKALAEITALETGILEKAESLEQLRWLENGYKIKLALTEHESFGIDTPEDLAHAKKLNIFKE